MMRWAIPVILLMVGCATPKSLSERPPLVEFETPLSPKAVASMVSEGWSAHTAEISTLINGDGFTISLTNPVAGVDATVIVLPKGTGSHVRFWERMPSLSPAWMAKPIREIPRM